MLRVMLSRSITTAGRRLRPSAALSGSLVQRQLRFASSQGSPTTNFYKTFTRPVAKVLLMAIFTYQLAYWGWVKLEQDEIRDQREKEITGLEAEVKRLQGPPAASSR